MFFCTACDLGDEFVSEHSHLIRQNYAWLTEKLDPNQDLLGFLHKKGVLSSRDYEKISFWKEKFKKNEMFLRLISRKSPIDFKHFQDALNKTLQQHINQNLTGAAADAESEIKLRTVKTRPENCSRTSGKRIPPKTPPKPRVRLLGTSAQPKPLEIPVTQPTNPSRFGSFAENHKITTQYHVNKRQVFNLETQFRKLQNELQTEVSTKIALLRQKMSSDNIWKICVEKILQESHKVKSQSQSRAAEEKCEKLRQEILQEKCKFITFQKETQQEKTRTEKQISILQGKVYHLETSLKATVNDNEELRKNLQESQLMVDSLKDLNQQTEQKTPERERVLSMQLNEAIEKLKLSDTEICKLYELQEESESIVKHYMELERKHHQENFEVKEVNETLRVKLALAKQEIGDQATRHAQKLKENESQQRETEKKLQETESRLRETEKKLEEMEPNLKLSLRETEEKLRVTETKLKETEAQLTVTQTSIEEFRGEDCTAKILDLEHKQEEERNSWMEEKKYLISQIQEQRRLIVGLQDKYTSDPVLIQIIKTKDRKNKNKRITGLTILDEELFIVSERSSEVEVYDSMKFSFSRRWNLKELINPTAIESSNRNKCLYIWDHRGSYALSVEILRVDPNGKLINEWSTEDDYGYGLSVTYESNVISTVFHKSKLNEYSPEGQLIREINLSSDAGIIFPVHAIKLTNGHFVVSYSVNSYPADGVCVVDGDGNLKKSFGGSSDGQVICPEYLAIDGNGFVMVADNAYSRILLLHSDLELKREILSKENHGLRHPTRILLDETNNRLFVADRGWNSKKRVYKDARILIFEFR